jgi:hypothetical protein
MKTLALALVGCLCFSVAAGVTRHGNNPAMWYGVSFGGADMIAIDSVTFETLSALYGPMWHTNQDGPQEGNVNACGELAVLICGAGEICCMCVYTEHCSFSCQDDGGGCTACPHCGPVVPDFGG